MNIRETLKDLGLTPKKGRGQNFLVDESVTQEVADFAELQPGENVLEVGPGLGILTERLLEQEIDLTVVEIEPALVRHLSATVLRGKSVRIVEEDIRNIRLEKIFPDSAQPIVVVSNVPYSISTEFVLWCLENRNRISRASLLLQREFAERVAAEPGGRDYGSLSVFRTVFATAELGPRIPPTAFFPEPAVESRLVRIVPRKRPLVDENETALFERTVRGAFAARRKTLLNSLLTSGIFRDKETAAKELSLLGIDPRRRAETLTLDEFLRLARSYGRTADLTVDE